MGVSFTAGNAFIGFKRGVGHANASGLNDVGFYGRVCARFKRGGGRQVGNASGLKLKDFMEQLQLGFINSTQKAGSDIKKLD